MLRHVFTMLYVQPARTVHTLDKLFYVDDIIAAAYRRQALHARVLGVLCKKIGCEDRVSESIIAKTLHVHHNCVSDLRHFYPATFQLMDRYRAAWKRWEHRKQKIDQQELLERQTQLVPGGDPLSRLIPAAHATA